MKARRCRKLAELRSGYLDGALADDERERVIGHLLWCDSCRAEVDELRRLRRLLSDMAVRPAQGSPPAGLSARLVSIAGEHAAAPVWSRPFRRTRRGNLPRRRIRHPRVTVATLAVGGLVVGYGLVGYLAAPEVRLPAVADPHERATAEFASALSQLPLATRGVDALMVTPHADQLGQSAPKASPRAVGRRVSQAVAVAALQRAATGGELVGYSGTERVLVTDDDGVFAATVRITSGPGQGSAVTVLDGHGHQVLERFVPANDTATTIAPLLSVLLQNYAVSGWQGGRLLGRPVTMVQASTGDHGRPVARWWIDDATGLLLQQETYDRNGTVALRAGFTTVTVGSSSTFLQHLPPRLAVDTATATVAYSPAELNSGGWFCASHLAGLSLLELHGDDPRRPGVLHLVYSDGVSTLSVFEQRGSLPAAAASGRWDDRVQAYVTSGTARSATWRSTDTVFTVVTSGPRSLLDSAVAALPHLRSLTPTTMERVRAGWSRIREHTTG